MNIRRSLVRQNRNLLAVTERLHSCNRVYGSEVCRRLSFRQMGKHQRIFRQEKDCGANVAIEW